MTSEEEIFEQALEFESDDERRAFLAGACAGDQQLATAVAELLAAHSDADQDDFLPADLGNEAPVREEEGSVIGRYKLLQKIGEGGFGVVYMAEQREPVKRRVALKIIKLGMDTKHVVGRFEAERQALAMMEHPNIANVLDAGATEHGRPFFVMELVRGIPVTQFCDEKHLSTDQRLTLFLDICSAVQHAHQKGIIHRDLKPNNVLVTVGDDGNRAHPKVIDFGIAKATQQELTDKTLFTRFEDFVGTPAYMSPEQAQYSQLDIDTRTDIYSLGVLLYELLAGRPPFDSDDLFNSGVDEIRRRIREDDPPRPSTRLHSLEEADRTIIAKARQADPELLQRKLRNEIDWIIMKAIDKDRSRRYGTAEALADDIENYLSDAPVEACPPTATYRLGKMFRRNRGAFTVVGAVIATLALGALVATWQAYQISKAKDRETQLLWNSYHVQAHATRKSNEPGRRIDTMATIARAAAIAPSGSLRNEAIAAMALPDLRRVALGDVGIGDRERSVIDDAGRRFVIGTPEGEVSIYDATTREIIAELPRQEGREVTGLLFSPDDRLLAVTTAPPGGVAEVALWDLEKLETVIAPIPARRGSVDISPDGKRLAVGMPRERAVLIFDLNSDEDPIKIETARLPGLIRFDPSGTRISVLATQGDQSEVARIHDIDGGSPPIELEHSRAVYSCAWHPGGDVVAIGSFDFNIYLWDLRKGKQIRVMRGHNAEVVRLDFHPTGRFLASASWDGTTRIWTPFAGENILTMPGTMQRFSADGHRLMVDLRRTGTGGIWEFTESAAKFTRYQLQGETYDKLVGLAFSPNADWLAASSKGIALWDLRTRQRIAWHGDISGRSLTFEPTAAHQLLVADSAGLIRLEVAGGGDNGQLIFRRGSTLLPGRPNRCALSGDGRTAAVTLLTSRKIQIIDVKSGSVRRVLDGPAGATFISISHEGGWVACGNWGGTGARVWNLAEPESEPVDLHEGQKPIFVTFDPRGRWLVTTNAESNLFWRIGQWNEPEHILPARSGAVTFSPDGSVVARRNGIDTIALTDTETMMDVAEFRPPGGNVTGLQNLTISPDGEHLAATTQHREIFVWDLPELRRELAQLGLDWK